MQKIPVATRTQQLHLSAEKTAALPLLRMAGNRQATAIESSFMTDGQQNQNRVRLKKPEGIKAAEIIRRLGGTSTSAHKGNSRA
jgi:hypothetical protein